MGMPTKLHIGTPRLYRGDYHSLTVTEMVLHRIQPAKAGTMKWNHSRNKDSIAYTTWNANTVRYFTQANNERTMM